MESELSRRVREALETPPLERIQKRNEVAKLQRESPDINSHLLLDLSDRERDFLRTKRWKALHARKVAEKTSPEMTFMPHTHRPGQPPPHGQQIEFLFRDELSRSNHDEYPGVFGLGNLSEGIKNIRDEYSVSVSRYPGAKPKPRHFYTKEGFMKALKTGNLPQGMHFLDDRGTYIDKYGVIRNNDGPFWPVECVPMFSTPRFKWWTALSPEPLYFHLPPIRLGLFQNSGLPSTMARRKDS
ncbi:hypothetical protein ElyMa_006687000 [Elysia marginata]|uniref:Uncharacterized protein n=1 Tax=Elysia marginata TaxID=1093978 RepID=A0AAV4ITI3_9GAST|nr:hypothetical protein ElyMa_006687000 [Elysia marginata]